MLFGGSGAGTKTTHTQGLHGVLKLELAWQLGS